MSSMGAPEPKKLRSSSAVKMSTVNKPVLSKLCVICSKSTKYLSRRGKTAKDPLYRATTLNAGMSEGECDYKVYSDSGCL